MKDISITVNSTGVSMTYGDVIATAPLADVTANWHSPKTLRIYMHSDGSPGVGHTMDVANMKFYNH